jgi:hypothetical protein
LSKYKRHLDAKGWMAGFFSTITVVIPWLTESSNSHRSWSHHGAGIISFPAMANPSNWSTRLRAALSTLYLGKKKVTQVGVISRTNFGS